MDSLPPELSETPAPLVALCSGSARWGPVLQASLTAANASACTGSYGGTTSPLPTYVYELLPLRHAFPRKLHSHVGDAELLAYQPAGLWKADWLRKHTRLLPGLVVLLFEIDVRPAVAAALSLATAGPSGSASMPGATVRSPLAAGGVNPFGDGASGASSGPSAVGGRVLAAPPPPDREWASLEAAIADTVNDVRASVSGGGRGIDVHVLLVQDNSPAGGEAPSPLFSRAVAEVGADRTQALRRRLGMDSSSLTLLLGSEVLAAAAAAGVSHGIIAAAAQAGGGGLTAEAVMSLAAAPAAQAASAPSHGHGGLVANARSALASLSAAASPIRGVGGAGAAGYGSPAVIGGAPSIAGASASATASPRAPPAGFSGAGAVSAVPSAGAAAFAAISTLEASLRAKVQRHYAWQTDRLKAKLARLGGHGILPATAPASSAVSAIPPSAGGTVAAASFASGFGSMLAPPGLRGSPVYRARIAFKISVFQELRGRPVKAIKYAAAAYRALVCAPLQAWYWAGGAAGSAGSSSGVSAGSSAVALHASEAKAVAEALNLRLCRNYLLFAGAPAIAAPAPSQGSAPQAAAQPQQLQWGGFVTPSGRRDVPPAQAAVMQFQFHVRCWERVKGDPALLPSHWAWLGRQYQVFAQLLQAYVPIPRAGAPMPAAAAGASRAALLPHHYLHTAALYAIRRRRAAEALALAPRPSVDGDAARLLQAMAGAGSGSGSDSAGFTSAAIAGDDNDIAALDVDAASSEALLEAGSEPASTPEGGVSSGAAAAGFRADGSSGSPRLTYRGVVAAARREANRVALLPPVYLGGWPRINPRRSAAGAPGGGLSDGSGSTTASASVAPAVGAFGYSGPVDPLTGMPLEVEGDGQALGDPLAAPAPAPAAPAPASAPAGASAPVATAETDDGPSNPHAFTRSILACSDASGAWPALYASALLAEAWPHTDHGASARSLLEAAQALSDDYAGLTGLVDAATRSSGSADAASHAAPLSLSSAFEDERVIISYAEQQQAKHSSSGAQLQPAGALFLACPISAPSGMLPAGQKVDGAHAAMQLPRYAIAAPSVRQALEPLLGCTAGPAAVPAGALAGRARVWRQALLAEEVACSANSLSSSPSSTAVTGHAAAYAAALGLLLPVAAAYRRRGWWQPLTRILPRLRELALLTRQWRIFVAASLQLLSPHCHSHAVPPAQAFIELRSVLQALPREDVALLSRGMSVGGDVAAMALAAATSAPVPLLALSVPALPPITPAAGVAPAGSKTVFGFGEGDAGSSGSALVPSAAALPFPLQSPLPSHVAATLREPAAPLLSVVVAFSQRQAQSALPGHDAPACGCSAAPSASGCDACCVTVRVIVSSNFPSDITLDELRLRFGHYRGDAAAALAAAVSDAANASANTGPPAVSNLAPVAGLQLLAGAAPLGDRGAGAEGPAPLQQSPFDLTLLHGSASAADAGVDAPDATGIRHIKGAAAGGNVTVDLSLPARGSLAFQYRVRASSAALRAAVAAGASVTAAGGTQPPAAAVDPLLLAMQAHAASADAAQPTTASAATALFSPPQPAVAPLSLAFKSVSGGPLLRPGRDSGRAAAHAEAVALAQAVASSLAAGGGASAAAAAAAAVTAAASAQGRPGPGSAHTGLIPHGYSSTEPAALLPVIPPLPAGIDGGAGAVPHLRFPGAAGASTVPVSLATGAVITAAAGSGASCSAASALSADASSADARVGWSGDDATAMLGETVVCTRATARWRIGPAVALSLELSPCMLAPAEADGDGDGESTSAALGAYSSGAGDGSGGAAPSALPRLQPAVAHAAALSFTAKSGRAAITRQGDGEAVSSGDAAGGRHRCYSCLLLVPALPDVSLRLLPGTSASSAASPTQAILRALQPHHLLPSMLRCVTAGAGRAVVATTDPLVISVPAQAPVLHALRLRVPAALLRGGAAALRLSIASADGTATWHVLVRGDAAVLLGSHAARAVAAASAVDVATAGAAASPDAPAAAAETSVETESATPAKKGKKGKAASAAAAAAVSAATRGDTDKGPALAANAGAAPSPAGTLPPGACTAAEAAASLGVAAFSSAAAGQLFDVAALQTAGARGLAVAAASSSNAGDAAATVSVSVPVWLVCTKQSGASAAADSRAVLSAFLEPSAAKPAAAAAPRDALPVTFAHHAVLVAGAAFAAAAPHPGAALHAAGASASGSRASKQLPQQSVEQPQPAPRVWSGADLTMVRKASPGSQQPSLELGAPAWPLLASTASAAVGRRGRSHGAAAGASSTATASRWQPQPVLLDLAALALHPSADAWAALAGVSSLRSSSSHAAIAAGSGAVVGAVRTESSFAMAVKMQVASPLPVRLLSASVVPAEIDAQGLRLATAAVDIARALGLVPVAAVHPHSGAAPLSSAIGGRGSMIGSLAATLSTLPGLPRDLRALASSSRAAAPSSSTAVAAAAAAATNPASRICQPGEVLTLPLTAVSGSASSPAASLGNLALRWKLLDGDASSAGGSGCGTDSEVTELVPLPAVAVHDPPLTADIAAPTAGDLGSPFAITLTLRNNTGSSRSAGGAGAASTFVLAVQLDHPSVGLWLRQSAADKQAAAAEAARRSVTGGSGVSSTGGGLSSAAQAAAALLRPPAPSSAAAPAATAVVAPAPPGAAPAAAVSTPVSVAQASGLPLAVTSGPLPGTVVCLRPGATATITWTCVALKRGCIPLPCVTVKAVALSAWSAAAAVAASSASSAPAVAAPLLAASAVLAGAPILSHPLLAASAAAQGASAQAASIAGAVAAARAPVTSSLSGHPMAAQAAGAQAQAQVQARLASLAGVPSAVPGAAGMAGASAVAASALLLGGPMPGGVDVAQRELLRRLNRRRGEPGVVIETSLSRSTGSAADDAAGDADDADGGLLLPPPAAVLEPPLCVIGGPLPPAAITVSAPSQRLQRLRGSGSGSGGHGAAAWDEETAPRRHSSVAGAAGGGGEDDAGELVPLTVQPRWQPLLPLLVD